MIGHINGGHTALPDDQIIYLCESCKMGLEIVHNGNERAALLTLNTARELKEMDRAQHAPGKTILESVQLGNLPGVGMTIIDGVVCSTRSRNTPPATKLPQVV